MLDVFIIDAISCAPCNTPFPYKQLLKQIRQSSMQFSPLKLQPPRVMDKNIKSQIKNHIIYRNTINWPSYCTTPFESIHLSRAALNNLLMVKETLVYFIACNCVNIHSTPSRTIMHFSKKFHFQHITCHITVKAIFPIATDVTTNQHYIIFPYIYLSLIQLENFILFAPLRQVQNSV